MKFSDEDRQRAMTMRASGAKLREIGETLGGATAHQISSLLRNIEDAEIREQRTEFMKSLGVGKVEPPEYLIDEAIQRRRFPRTITMWFFGDPVLHQNVLHPKHFQRLRKEVRHEQPVIATH